MDETKILVPAEVPTHHKQTFIQNYQKLMQDTSRLLLFSADQKIEHMNDDFFGSDIPRECNDPLHIFRIAQQAPIGALATQLGLIARYGLDFPDVHYVIKMNAKTNLANRLKPYFWRYSSMTKLSVDPNSASLYDVQQVITIKEQTKLPICGIGITVYLGSKFESSMLSYAADTIFQAHQNGLIAIVWMYPRGFSISGNENNGKLIAGAAGVANAIGADFVKLQPPKAGSGMSSAQWLSIAAQAAGNTKIIVACGKRIDEKILLNTVKQQLLVGHTAGIAIGRNLLQRSLHDAVQLVYKLFALLST